MTCPALLVVLASSLHVRQIVEEAGVRRLMIHTSATAAGVTGMTASVSNKALPVFCRWSAKQVLRHCCWLSSSPSHCCCRPMPSLRQLRQLRSRMTCVRWGWQAHGLPCPFERALDDLTRCLLGTWRLAVSMLELSFDVLIISCWANGQARQDTTMLMKKRQLTDQP